MVKEALHYIEGSCINCGRARVEEYTNGDIICEKCAYNQETETFEDLDEIAMLQMEAEHEQLNNLFN